MSFFDTYDLATLRREMKEQDKRKWLDPDLPRGAEWVPTVWVAYVWQEATKTRPAAWILQGFVRTKHLRIPKLARIRQNFRIKPKQTMTLLELFHCARVGGPARPPARFNPIVRKPRRRSA